MLASVKNTIERPRASRVLARHCSANYVHFKKKIEPKKRVALTKQLFIFTKL